MSRGLGCVQRACLGRIRKYEEEGKRWPTTFNIAADIYQIKRKAKDNRLVSNAQHVATKRALESLQRQGHIIGFRDTNLARNPPHDGRIELAHIWMTEVGLLRWVQQQEEHVRESESANPVFYIETIQKTQAVVARARSLGMDIASPLR